MKPRRTWRDLQAPHWSRLYDEEYKAAKRERRRSNRRNNQIVEQRLRDDPALRTPGLIRRILNWLY